MICVFWCYNFFLKHFVCFKWKSKGQVYVKKTYKVLKSTWKLEVEIKLKEDEMLRENYYINSYYQNIFTYKAYKLTYIELITKNWTDIHGATSPYTAKAISHKAWNTSEHLRCICKHDASEFHSNKLKKGLRAGTSKESMKLQKHQYHIFTVCMYTMKRIFYTPRVFSYKSYV